LLNDDVNTARQYAAGGSLRYDYTLKEVLTLGLSASITQQQTKYSFSTAQNQQFLNQTYTAEANFNFLKYYSFSPAFQFYSYKSQTTGFEQSIPLLNLSVSRFLLKAKSGELKIGVMNLLDKSFGVTQTASVNYLQQVTSNNIGRYFMISFTYALNKQANPLGGQRHGTSVRMIRN
jgi:outer membrane receptor for ferrienterochelin and colicin